MSTGDTISYVSKLKNAMINALQTVDTNHATHEQTIRAQTQYLQQLTTRLDTLEAANAGSFGGTRKTQCIHARTRKRIRSKGPIGGP